MSDVDCSIASRQALRPDGGSPDDKALADRVLAAFNTWAFKREQPSDTGQLLSTLARKIERRLPVEFVLYWGKGPRNALGQPEVQCFEFLTALQKRVAAQYAPGAEMRLICTDTHARLNGHASRDATAYFHSVGEAASRRGFKWCLLADLVEARRDNIGSPCPAERPSETISQLERSAARWYRGAGRPIDGAIAYFDMNMIERAAVEREFPDAIFVTFSGSELRELFPVRMPIFYMYSVRKGVSTKPWFIETEPPLRVAG